WARPWNRAVVARPDPGPTTRSPPSPSRRAPCAAPTCRRIRAARRRDGRRRPGRDADRPLRLALVAQDAAGPPLLGQLRATEDVALVVRQFQQHDSAVTT